MTVFRLSQLQSRSSFLVYNLALYFNKRNTMGDTNGAGIVYPSEFNVSLDKMNNTQTIYKIMLPIAICNK